MQITAVKSRTVVYISDYREIEELITTAFVYESVIKMQDKFCMRRSLSNKISSVYSGFKQNDPLTVYLLSYETDTPIPTLLGYFNDSQPSRGYSGKQAIVKALESCLELLRRYCSDTELFIIRSRLYDAKTWSQIDKRFNARTNKRRYLAILTREVERGKITAILKPFLIVKEI
jgi:hypothetical protein